MFDMSHYRKNMNKNKSFYFYFVYMPLFPMKIKKKEYQNSTVLFWLRGYL